MPIQQARLCFDHYNDLSVHHARIVRDGPCDVWYVLVDVYRGQLNLGQKVITQQKHYIQTTSSHPEINPIEHSFGRSTTGSISTCRRRCHPEPKSIYIPFFPSSFPPSSSSSASNTSSMFSSSAFSNSPPSSSAPASKSRLTSASEVSAAPSREGEGGEGKGQKHTRGEKPVMHLAFDSISVGQCPASSRKPPTPALSVCIFVRLRAIIAHELEAREGRTTCRRGIKT